MAAWEQLGYRTTVIFCRTSSNFRPGEGLATLACGKDESAALGRKFRLFGGGAAPSTRWPAADALSFSQGNTFQDATVSVGDIAGGIITVGRTADLLRIARRSRVHHRA
jgi:hypothetical protein